ncbi:MAG: cytochrome b [Alphaproteobacteria bacterium]|nr:cytochrome b [Alphaproteobacteria bacterium]
MTSNAPTRYGTVAMALHWTIAIAIVSLLIVGKYMNGLPNNDPNKFALYQLHKSFGITVLVLTVVRIIWRVMHPVPALPAGMPAWQRWGAHVSHFGLYALMLAIPLSGWAAASSSSLGIPTMLFGAAELPSLPVGNDRDTHEFYEEAHELLGNLMILLLIVHVVAALKHHFVDRDTVLRRMLPFTRV